MGRSWECKKATKIGWHDHNSKFENSKQQKNKKRKRRSEKVKNRRGGEFWAIGDRSQNNRKKRKHETTDRKRVAENRNWSVGW